MNSARMWLPVQILRLGAWVSTILVVLETRHEEFP